MPEYHDKQTQRILRKVDFRLIPLLTFLYVLSFLDRSNIVSPCLRGDSDTRAVVLLRVSMNRRVGTMGRTARIMHSSELLLPAQAVALLTL